MTVCRLRQMNAPARATAMTASTHPRATVSLASTAQAGPRWRQEERRRTAPPAHLSSASRFASAHLVGAELAILQLDLGPSLLKCGDEQQ